MKRNIALVAGGYSGEFEVSLRSAEQIFRNLDKDKYDVYRIVITRQSWYCEYEGEKTEVDRNDFSIRLDGRKITFDAAFITVHGTPGENGLLQAYFDMISLPYTTCSSLVSAVTFDKAVCNACVRELGIVDVAKNVHTFKDAPLSVDQILSRVSLPVFVKPSEGGSSIGMSKVRTREELPQALDKAYRVHPKVLLEEFIEGREFSCGVMRLGGSVEAFPVTEIRPDTDFFDYDAKYNGLSKEITPAPVDEKLSERIRKATRDVYEGLSCNGVCRVDFIYDDAKDRLYFLEVNTTPGQSEQSIVPQQVRAMGKDTRWLYNTVLEQLDI